MDKYSLFFLLQTTASQATEDPLLWIFQIMIQWWFKSIIVPIITLFLTIFFRIISKPAISFERNDGFVCFDLCTSAILVFIIGMVDLANQWVNSPKDKVTELLTTQKVDTSKIIELQDLLDTQTQIIMTKFGLSSLVLTIMILMTVVISVITRCLGWDSSTNQPKWFWGIIVPNFSALILLIISAIWIRP